MKGCSLQGLSNLHSPVDFKRVGNEEEIILDPRGLWGNNSILSSFKGRGSRASGNLCYRAWCGMLQVCTSPASSWGRSSCSCSFVSRAGVKIKATTPFGGLVVGSESIRITPDHFPCQEDNRPCLPSRGAGPSRWPDLVCANQELPLLPGWGLGFDNSPGFSQSSSSLKKMLLVQTEYHKIALKWFGEGSLNLGLLREQKEDFDKNLPCVFHVWSHLILTAQ